MRTSAPRTTTRRRRSSQGGDFQPIWRRSHEDEAFDPLEADPTVRTELLAKVRDVPFSGVDRNIFEFTQRRAKVAPPPPAMANAAQKRQEEFEARAKARANAAPAKPSAPRAPKLTWKYYGFASEAAVGKRRAFLLDGEDVLIASEGDTLKGGRYKIKRIGLSSIVIEDTQFEQEQSLALTAPQG